MVFQLFGLFAAAALVVSGPGSSTEIRSAQSLPAPSVQGLAAARAASGPYGGSYAGNQLAHYYPGVFNAAQCKRMHGNWSANGQGNSGLRCRKARWWFEDGSRLLISAVSLAGLLDAVINLYHPEDGISN